MMFRLSTLTLSVSAGAEEYVLLVSQNETQSNGNGPRITTGAFTD